MSKALVPQIFLFEEEQKNPEGESHGADYNVNFPLRLSKNTVSPPNLDLSPRKSILSPRKNSSIFGAFYKKPQSAKLREEESKKLKEKLANISIGKKRSSRVHSKSSTISIKTKTKDIGSTNYLWIVFFVKKFVSILKINVLLKKLSKMKAYHYQLIGDKTHYNADLNMLYSIMRENNPLYHSEILKKSTFNRVKEIFEKLFRCILEFFLKIEVLQPDKFFVSFWNFIMLFFVFINALYIPLKIGFEIEQDQMNGWLYMIVEAIPVWIFIFDIFLTINTAYYSKGVFICDRYKIIKHYLKYFLLLDLVTIGPFLLGYFSSIGYVEMLFMLRIFKLKASIRKLEEFLQLRDLYGGNFQLIKLMGLIFYMAHISCCGWNYLASVEISYGVSFTWLDLLGIRNSPWEVKYVNSLYYSIVTMVTVGYGDITPQNTTEKIFSICYIGMACGIFAYGVNEVGTILRDMHKSENDFKAQFLSMNAYMKSRGLNKALQLRVQKYLEYMHEENKFGYKNGDLLLSSLSSKLKQEVLMDIYGKILREYNVFNANFSNEFIKRIALKLREMTFAPDDIIVEENDNYDKSLYFILKGEVECFQMMKNENAQKQMTFRFLKKGENFGSFSFFTDEKRDLSVKSVNITHIVCLSQHDFLDTIKDFPEDFESYRMLVDSIKVYNKLSELQIPCASCGELDHLSSKCDLIGYKPIPLKIIKIFQENRYQKRKFFVRAKRQPFKTLQKQCKIEYEATKFQNSESDALEEHQFKYLAMESEPAESSSVSESIPIESLENISEEKNIPPPQILVKNVSENSDDKAKKDDLTPIIRNNSRKISADGDFFSSRLKIFFPKTLDSPENRKPNKNKNKSPTPKTPKSPVEKRKSNDKKFNPPVQNYLGANSNNFENPLLSLKRRKSMISMSQYDLDKNEENMLDEIDIRQEFDLLKHYKLYFPHNNCEAVLENLRKAFLLQKQKALSIFSPRTRRKKTKSNQNVKLMETKENLEQKKNNQKRSKEKTFLVGFIRKNLRNPTFHNLVKGFQ